MEGIVLTVVSVLVGVAGVFAHFYKKKLKDPSFSNLKKYVANHSVYSIMAVGVTVIGSAGLATATGSVPLDYGAMLAYFTQCVGIGYACDSVINKYVAESPE
jgi:hypothetical protein